MFKSIFVTQVIGIPLGSLAVFIFGTWTPLMGVLLVLCVLDIITGVAKGFYNKDLRSRSMSQGMIRKAMIFVVIIIANLIDMVCATMTLGLPVIKVLTIMFYIIQEGLSVLENLGQMNVPLPSFISERLRVLQDLADKSVEVKTVEQIIVKPVDDAIQIETKSKE